VQGRPTAGCVPLACTTANGDQYCGTIGDGCGNSVDCGTTCTKLGWTCQDNLCKAAPAAHCVPLACTTANGDQYCGTIGDGCGIRWTVAAPAARPVDLRGQPVQRSRRSVHATHCNPASGGQYCGTIGDGCGHSLGCSTDCSAAGSGWVCGSKNVCVGGAGCVKLTCNNTSAAQQYCGDVGDGCGGR